MAHETRYGKLWQCLDIGQPDTDVLRLNTRQSEIISRINRISTLILNPLLSVQKQNTLTKFCAFLTGGLATNNAKCRKHCDFQVHISSENSSTTKPKYFSKSLGNFEQISNPFILLVGFSVGILRKFRTAGYLGLETSVPGLPGI